MADVKTFKCHKCGALHYAEKQADGTIKISLYHKEESEEEEEEKDGKGKRKKEEKDDWDIFV